MAKLLSIKNFACTLLWLFCLLYLLPVQAGIIYVKSNAGGANNGGSWNDAYIDLQSALVAANSGDDIWVAAGTYYPTSTTDRTISFVMKNGVGIYGGFDGTETILSQRDWTINLTTLSGDIGIPDDKNDNSHHVIYNFSIPNDPMGIDNTAVLDGFIITLGNANDITGLGPFGGNQGGGMFNFGSAPTVTNCIFIDNEASGSGGGMHVNLSNPIVTNCSFIGNSGDSGGGLYLEGNGLGVTNCFFGENSANTGAGILTSFGSPVMSNCSFIGNTASDSGGAISNSGGTSSAINCSFNANSAPQGGSIYNEFDNGTPVTVVNCILWGNNSEIFTNPTYTTAVSFSIVEGGYPGLNNLDADPLFISLDNLQLQPGSPAINAGNNNAVLPSVTTDLAGETRIMGGTVDIGAYEKSASTAGGDCDDVSITSGNNMITVSGLDATPISQLQIFNASWQTIFNCSGDCNTTEMINASPGSYYVKVKLYTSNWQSICQITEDVTVGQGNPCVNEGGDYDGDSICANDDCDDNNSNIPTTPGTACNDGNPNTSNDVIQSDGCSCQGTVVTGGGDCEDVSITLGNGMITVSGLDATPISQLQIFNANWQTVFNCSGDCNPTEMINTSSGTYHVKVKLYTSNWQPICSITEDLTVGGGGDYEDVSIAPGDGMITVSGLNATPISQLQVFNASWQKVFNCSGNCNETEMVNVPSGTYHVKVKLYTANWQTICTITEDLTVTAGGGGGCDDVSITPGNSMITVSNLNAAPISQLQIFNESWQKIFNCSGDCNATEIISVSSGLYHVRVKLYTDNWQNICQILEDITVSENNPLQSEEDEVLFLNARKAGRAVILNWVTNTDYKNDYFDIERSIDGVKFKRINQIISAGESANHINYRMKDEDALFGVNYYRVKEVFIDGTYRYSQVKEVTFNLDVDKFSLFPNPADNEVYISLKDFVGNKGMVKIHNSLGQIVYKEIFVDIPAHPIHVSISDLSGGVYTVSVKVKDKKIMTRLLMISKM